MTLSQAEEVSLASAWRRDGDRSARERLITENLGLARKIAQRYRSFGLDLEDLFAEGFEGVILAADRFDPDRGIRFSTYAGWWIRARITRFVSRNVSLVGGNQGAFHTGTLFALRRFRAVVSATLGEGPEADAELARLMGVSVDSVRDMCARIGSRDQSLDAPAGPDSPACGLDILPSPAPSAEEMYLAIEQDRIHTEVAQAALEVLEPRLRLIIESRVLVDPEDVMSLQGLGEALGVTRERVRQLEGKALKRLRASLEIEYGKRKDQEHRRGRDAKALPKRWGRSRKQTTETTPALEA